VKEWFLCLRVRGWNKKSSLPSNQSPKILLRCVSFIQEYLSKSGNSSLWVSKKLLPIEKRPAHTGVYLKTCTEG
jgi:hypothetical protein